MTSTTMAAVLLTGHGGPDKPDYQTDVAIARPAGGAVRVEAAAAGINNTDVSLAWGADRRVAVSTTIQGRKNEGLARLKLNKLNAERDPR